KRHQHAYGHRRPLNQACALRRRRRAMAIRPPQATISPGRPAPTTGAGTLTSTAPVLGTQPLLPQGTAVPLEISAAKSWPRAFGSLKLPIVRPATLLIWKLKDVRSPQLLPLDFVQLNPYSKKPVPSIWRLPAVVLTKVQSEAAPVPRLELI